MPAIREVAVAYYRQQARVAQLTVAAVERAWAGLDRANLSQSYATGAGPAMVSALTAGQQLAASTGQSYVAAAVDAQGGVSQASGALVPTAFAGVAADGRSLASLLYLPVVGAKLDIASGSSVDAAMASALSHLSMLVDTEVADAGRSAVSTAMTSDRKVHGYVRMVSGSACSRCIILAGRFYRYNAGFQRHPHDQCTSIPAIENAPDLRTDPHAFFDNMSKAEQNARFGAADAEAIRSGADMFQVVNAHRGVYTAGDVFGRSVQATSEGVTKRGIAGQRMRANLPAGRPQGLRLTVAQISKDAGEDRDLAISLLKKYGYLI